MCNLITDPGNFLFDGYFIGRLKSNTHEARDHN